MLRVLGIRGIVCMRGATNTETQQARVIRPGTNPKVCAVHGTLQLMDSLQIIDTHCHLDLPVFDADRAQVLQQARLAGLCGFVIPGVERKTWPGLLALCAAQEDCHPALGLHPMFLARHQAADLDALQRGLQENHPVALGEIGLDFYHPDTDRSAQLAIFEAQLMLAQTHRLPVLLHVRKAHEDVLRLLRRIPVTGGIAHAFNGSLQQAHRYLDMGFKLGFGGMLSFARSSKLRTLAKALPDSALVMETDAPDMSGEVCRGQRNSPEYLPDYLRVLAQLRDRSPQDMARLTSGNARAVLNLDAV